LANNTFLDKLDFSRAPFPRNETLQSLGTKSLDFQVVEDAVKI
jgi:hypothetical protein